MRLINRRPDRASWMLLAALPFVAVLVAYAFGSAVRLAENPSDKLLPGLAAFADAIDRMAFTPDRRTGDILLWLDTGTSLLRLLSGIAIASAGGLLVGMAAGLLPHVRAALSPFVTVLSMVPPLAVLPILFIVVGLGEASKVTLIVIGVMPCLIRDMMLKIDDLPRQQLIKAQTLGANSWTVAIRVVLPQIVPRLIDSVRLNLGPAWLFLISAEAIASEAGLGYRIFLVRRYLAMDVILPYVAWITLLCFLMDLGLRVLQRRAFPWFQDARAAA
ncbi:ABC transporter permease [Niveispirillum fermenti]|uniref:ABC transporter permease n=1 Tax=Niveispirillum fermenti TaxID=1233113 RepID=UPI003A8C6C1D